MSRPVGGTAALVAVALAGCAGALPDRGDDVEATSLFGTPLRAPALPPEVRATYERELAEARAAHDPQSVEGRIWIGRRLAYLGRFREAVAEFDAGLARRPDEPRLLRHRGHRRITLRDFAGAAADLERAERLLDGRPDEIEPDGRPNAANRPIGTLHSNVRYHLGLARYLQADFLGAAAAFRRDFAAATNDDRRCSAAYWLYLSLRRAGRPIEAASAIVDVRGDMDVVENDAYRELCLMFRGLRDPDVLLAQARAGSGNAFPTVAYGVWAHRELVGDVKGAYALLYEIVERGPWPAFGAIAAEAELRRQATGE